MPRTSGPCRSPAFFCVCVVLAAAVSAGAVDPTLTETVVSSAARVEAEWCSPAMIAQVRGATARTPVSTQDDAAGGCDGIKNGKWGFHTAAETDPWWQVDLGRPQPLARALIYNRCDSGTAARTTRFTIMLSDDARQWREVYRHGGEVFLGATDGKPLALDLRGQKARFLRFQLQGTGYLHLDEVEVYGTADPSANLALGRPADQSSVSQWSTRKTAAGDRVRYPVAEVIARGRRLAADLAASGVDTDRALRTLDAIEAAALALPPDAPADAGRALYLKARWTVRRIALANPLLDFDAIVFAKHVPGMYSHMSDQYYGWWSRPGGGIFVLEGFKGERPTVRCLTADMTPGSFLRPDLSYDGRRVLFAYARYYPHVAGMANKVEKEKIPEDAFYHLYEVNIDGTGLRAITRGRYDDFDGRYLPGGDIVFLSTRRGQALQCTPATAEETLRATLPDSYVRCGGGNSRPVAVYTLHTMDAHGRNLRAISPFENFEWTPSVAADGRIIYARWDYVDRDNMPYMKLWATNPDGTLARALFGNFTKNPHCVFEARSVPNSTKILFTASGHHSITGGSLVLLDLGVGVDGDAPMTRLTPEVCFPESEGWPATYYASPYPLSETYCLTAWSPVPLNHEGGPNPPNALGLYLYDAFGNLELLYRDEAISSHCPLPLKPRPRPPVVASSVAWDGPQEGRLLLQDVYQGLGEIERGTVRQLRIVAMPAKTQPQMNSPRLGVTRDDPGKCVLGTVPVEADGSAYFRVPSGVAMFFQALDGQGRAVQTMRSLTYVQPGQTVGCVGCHERRDSAPPAVRPMALRREPSKITVGPEGSWPLRFDRLVQPVLDRSCVSCHRPDAADKTAARFDLTPAKAYDSLIAYGGPSSLKEQVLAAYRAGRSEVGQCGAAKSPLLTLLTHGNGHYGVRLDDDGLQRLTIWLDTYGQLLGSFSAEQERQLAALRKAWADMLRE